MSAARRPLVPVREFAGRFTGHCLPARLCFIHVPRASCAAIECRHFHLTRSDALIDPTLAVTPLSPFRELAVHWVFGQARRILLHPFCFFQRTVARCTTIVVMRLDPTLARGQAIAALFCCPLTPLLKCAVLWGAIPARLHGARLTDNLLSRALVRFGHEGCVHVLRCGSDRPSTRTYHSREERQASMHHTPDHHHLPRGFKPKLLCLPGHFS